MSGSGKPPLVEKVKKRAVTDNTITFSNEKVSISLAGPAEDIGYFKDWDTFVVTFQPVAPDDDETK
jgi:hypothetical protein